MPCSETGPNLRTSLLTIVGYGSPNRVVLVVLTKPWVCIDDRSTKKPVHDLLHISTLNQFFWCRIVILRLLQLNIKTRDIPEFLAAICLQSWQCKPFINTSSLHTFFAQCLSSSSFFSKKWELGAWTLEQIFKINLASYGWLVINTADDNFERRLPKKYSNWRSKLVQSHGFQKSHLCHFICYQLSCKLYLLLIQNHARHCFQAFAHSHLRLLCCLVGIWANTLSSDW